MDVETEIQAVVGQIGQRLVGAEPQMQAAITSAEQTMASAMDRFGKLIQFGQSAVATAETLAERFTGQPAVGDGQATSDGTKPIQGGTVAELHDLASQLEGLFMRMSSGVTRSLKAHG